MSEEKIIYPEDVILEPADVPIYKVTTEQGVYYTESEQHARSVMATHKHCYNLACDRPAQYGLLYCQECEYLKRLADRAKAPMWDGKFPLMDEDSEKWFSDLDELAEFCFEKDVLPEDRFLRTGDARMATDIDVSYDDLLGEDESELSIPELQQYVDDFKEGLKNFTKPVCWYEDKIVQLPAEIVAEIRRKCLEWAAK